MMKKNKPKCPLKQVLRNFEDATKSPLDYLKEQNEYAEKNRSMVKSLFEYAKISGKHFQSNSLPDELYTDNMDEEQIWQQLELQNNSFWNKCMKETCRLLSINENKLALNIQYDDENQESKENDKDHELEDDQVENRQETEGEHFENKNEEENISDNGDDEESIEETDDDDSEAEQNSENDLGNANKAKNASGSLVDDSFFKLNEMEAFLDSEDKKELDKLNGKKTNRADNEDELDEIDYFDTMSTDSESENEEVDQLKYADFFGMDERPPGSVEEKRQRRKEEREQKNRRKAQQMKEDLGIDESEPEDESDANGHLSDQNEIENEEEDDDNADENENDEHEEATKSEFDLRQNRLQRRIAELEENALGEKPWQLKGEITSASRPKNSLLEEIVEFDTTARPAPLITEETTFCLEDIIKRRIKSKAWDDVERKIKPTNEHKEFRKNLVISQEKSKESLAQIYEKEYLDKINKMNNIDTDGLKPDEPAEHTEIRNALKSLFLKLDALSNFHYTAKPVALEAKIITNIPAINMEEVAPIAVSDAALLAPEEIRARPVGDEIGKSERSTSDKNRERRKKKQKQKLIKKTNDRRIEEKEKLGIKVTTKEKQQQLMNQVTKNRNVIKAKNTLNDDGKALKSSKSFFTQLQDSVSSVKSKLGSKKKSSTERPKSNAKRLKL